MAFSRKQPVAFYVCVLCIHSGYFVVEKHGGNEEDSTVYCTILKSVMWSGI